jgi:hypothetical protein
MDLPEQPADDATDEGAPRWWAIRRVRSDKPATYRCPFCGHPLHAMSDHVLIAPEADGNRRRHAHTSCVLAAREAGELPTRDEWRADRTRGPGLLARFLRRGRRSAG